MPRTKIRLNAHTVKFLPSKDINKIKLKTSYNDRWIKKYFQMLFKGKCERKQKALTKNLEEILMESYKENNLLKI